MGVGTTDICSSCCYFLFFFWSEGGGWIKYEPTDERRMSAAPSPSLQTARAF